MTLRPGQAGWLPSPGPGPGAGAVPISPRPGLDRRHEREQHGRDDADAQIQRPGTATFQMQSCAAAGCPYGWQWVPNWPDGSYFWMAAPAVEGTSLYVIGERISPSAGKVEGEYTARFAVGAATPYLPGHHRAHRRGGRFPVGVSHA